MLDKIAAFIGGGLLVLLGIYGLINFFHGYGMSRIAYIVWIPGLTKLLVPKKEASVL